jgi:hypothetical protein
MIGLLVAGYFAGSAGAAFGALLPGKSGLPRLIHCSVNETGREPICRYTASSGGEKLRNGLCCSPSESGGKSTIIFNPYTPLTGYGPTPNPALVRALASEIAASPSFWKTCCDSSFGSQDLYDPGEYTLIPSLRLRETPERCSVINSGRQPNLIRIWAISFAMFCASGSPGTTCSSTLVPAQRSNPANQTFALGSSSIPISPACLGSSTVWSARFSAVETHRCAMLLRMRFPVPHGEEARSAVSNHDAAGTASLRRIPPVEPRPRAFDFGLMLMRPGPERFDRCR